MKNNISKAITYWQKRFETVENETHEFAMSSYRKIEKAFRAVQQETNNKIETYFNRIATNNLITLLQAKRKLNTNELKEFRWSVQEYIEKGQENAVNKQWIQELENASAKAHITRLQALQVHTQQILEMAFANQVDEVDHMIKSVYMDNFNKSSWILQTGNQTAFNTGAIDERQLELIMKKPWTNDGKEFSSRIWNNKTHMVNDLHNELTKLLYVVVHQIKL